MIDHVYDRSRLTKLAVIGAVALVVIGPKDLPKVARMAGTLFGRAQRYISREDGSQSRNGNGRAA